MKHLRICLIIGMVVVGGLLIWLVPSPTELWASGSRNLQCQGTVPCTKTPTPPPPPEREPTETPTPTAPPPQTFAHVVQPGETLASIAATFNTTVEVLKQLNQLDSDTITVGQQLIIPGTPPPAPPAAPSSTPSATRTATARPSATSTPTIAATATATETSTATSSPSPSPSATATASLTPVNTVEATATANVAVTTPPSGSIPFVGVGLLVGLILVVAGVVVSALRRQ